MQKAGADSAKNLKNKAIYNLLQKPKYLTAQRYLLANHFKAFYVYYPKGQEELGNELCVAPQEVLIQDSDNMVKKEVIFNNNPFFVKNGELGINLVIDKTEKRLAADSFNELLKIGEEMVYQNDLEATVSLEELKGLGISEETSGEILAELNDGKISSRIRQYIEKNGFSNFVAWHKVNSREKNKQQEIENKVAELLQHKFRLENPIAQKYSNCLGLFNYDRENLNFDKYFGRGEHNVYFNYLISLKYGVFTPFSFVNITKDKENSQKVFYRLVENNIMNKNGHLNSAQKKNNLNFLKDLLSTKQFAELKKFIEEMRARREKIAYQNIIEKLKDKNYSSRIEEELVKERLPLQNLAELISSLTDAEKQKVEQLYLQTIISNEIENEVPKNRGIILDDNKNNVLILVSDLVDKTAPYYNYLLAYFRALFPDKQLNLAYAYTNPSPRTAQTKKNPLVMALYSIVQLRTSNDYETVYVDPEEYD